MPTITFTSPHGFSMTAGSLPIPVYRDEATGNIVIADSLDKNTHTDFFVTSVPDTLTLEIEFSGMVNIPSHGLTVGEYYFLGPGGTFQLIPSVVDDPIYYIIDDDNIKLLDIRPIATNGCACCFAIPDSDFMTLMGLDSLTAKQQTILDMAKESTQSLMEDYLKTGLGYQQHVELLRVSNAQLDGMFVPFDRTDFLHIDSRRTQERTGLEMISLTNKPVHTTGLRVWVDTDAMAGQNVSGAFQTATELKIGVDFYLDVDNFAEGTSKSGILHLNHASWPMVPRSIKVQYYAGDKALPGSIKGEFTKNVMHNFYALSSIADKGGRVVISESLGKYSYSLDSSTVATFANMGGWSLLPSTYAALANSGLKSYRYM